MVIMLTLMAIILVIGVMLGLAAFGVASIGTILMIGFKAGLIVIPIYICVRLVCWAIGI